MLGSVLPFSPELADRVSEYCEKHSEGRFFLLRKPVESVATVFQAGTSSRFSSVTGSSGQAMGMDSSPLLRRRNDVFQAARSMDDMDGPVDCTKAR